MTEIYPNPLQLPYRIILASASPRRKQLLEGLGLQFSIQPVEADESQWPSSLQAEAIPLYLAEHKSREFPRTLESDELLITSDTVVWCEGQVLNKPADFSEAFTMLRQLSGKMHEVFTAVCLRSENKKSLFFDRTRVYFRELSDQEINFYITQYKPFDKAGAYGAQDWIGYVGVERIEGSYFNVMGLPLKMLYEELSRF